MFFTNFVISFIVSSITIAVIMLIKKVFQKQLSAKWQYNLWFLLLVALTLPFIPSQFIHFSIDFISLNGNQSNGVGSSFTNTRAADAPSNVNWMQDFALTVNRFNPELLNLILAGIWMLGMVFFAVLTIRAWIRLNNIKKTVYGLENQEVAILFEQCKQHLNISKKVVLGVSPLINSPLTFGLIKTYVVLPADFSEWLSKKDMKHIFLHELNHYKYKDIAVNYLTVIYQIIYWFHPLVWIAFKEMRLDREIACDSRVLNSLDEHCYKDYGNTIIHFVDRTSKSRNYMLANQLNGSKEQIKRRIKKISSFTTESKRLKLKSIGIFILAGVFVASQLPLVSVMADSHNRYDFNGERTVYEDLSEYFDGYEGSFVLYDMKADRYRIYNENKSTMRVSPDSTYKIYSALFGLESDAISSDNSTLKWNGQSYPYDSWNKDQNLSTAMGDSVTWYFQALDKRTDLNNIQGYLNEIDYGNQDVSNGIEQYWLESSLKISPVEQVQLLNSFYKNEFQFKEKNIQTVKDTLKLSKKKNLRLSGKTGTGNVNGNDINGWFIGYVETKENTYFFATNIQNGDNSSGSKATEITLSILKDKGIY